MTGSLIPHFGLVRQYDNLKEELLEATDLALRDGCWVDGEYTRRFENWLELRTGEGYALTVGSGTQALEFIARFTAVSYKDMYGYYPTVFVPNITYPATLNAFLNAGFNVELADTDRNGLLDCNRLDYDSYPFAFLCQVGLYGATPMTNNRGTGGTIVDGAQHWLNSNGVYGFDMAISFDPTKNLPSSGNGGAIITYDDKMYEWIKEYRNNGKQSHNTAGTNSRMSEQDCAQILVRTKYIDQWQSRRKQIREYYLDRFKNLNDIRCLSSGFVEHSDQKFVIYSTERDALSNYLQSMGIEVKIHYGYTLGELPIAATLKKPSFLSTSYMLTRGVLSLPIYPELTDNEIEYIADTVLVFFMKLRTSKKV